MLTLNDGRNELWQWDTGRTLSVDAECSQVHFGRNVYGRSIDVDVIDGVAEIPDVLLQTDRPFTAWAFVGTPENGYTKISKEFVVNKRNKPADYVFTQEEKITLRDVIKRLEDVEENQSPEAIAKIVNDYLEENPVESPVQSVNGKTGNIHLNAEDVGALPQGTKIPKEYVLPSASTDHLGGIKADPVTAEDIQPVRIGEDGKLYTIPGGGGNGEGGASEWVVIADVNTDGDTAVYEFTGLNYREVIVDFYFDGKYSTNSGYTTFSVNGVNCKVARLIRSDASPAFQFRVEIVSNVMCEHQIFGVMGCAASSEVAWTVMPTADKINTFKIGAGINHKFDAGSRLIVRGRA